MPASSSRCGAGFESRYSRTADRTTVVVDVVVVVVAKALRLCMGQVELMGEGCVKGESNAASNEVTCKTRL